MRRIGFPLQAALEADVDPAPWFLQLSGFHLSMNSG
jgi:hypothetical protein